MLEGYWDVRRVAHYYGCSVPTVWRRARDGRIPGPVKIGRLTRWLVPEIVAHRFTRAPRTTAGRRASADLRTTLQASVKETAAARQEDASVQSRTSSSLSSPAQVVGDVDGHPQEPDPNLRGVLRAIGVSGPSLDELAARIDLSHLDPLLLVASRAADRGENIAAHVVNRLKRHDGWADDDVLIDDEEQARARLIRAKIIGIAHGRWDVDLQKLAVTDLPTLHDIDGTWTFEDEMLVALSLNYDDDDADFCDLSDLNSGRTVNRHNDAFLMARVFGGVAHDYHPLLAHTPAWKVTPRLSAALRERHPDPVEYARERLGIDRRPG